MIQDLVKRLDYILACPYCIESLKIRENGLYCISCDTTYPFINDRQVDLRLQKPKTYTLLFEVGKDLQEIINFNYQPLDPPPRRFSKELVKHMPNASHPDALALDLGCGTTAHKPMLEQVGFQYVGMDYSDKQAPILGDAHALPFKDESFEFILSMNVLEHLQYPPVAYLEVKRVLQTGCRILGGVSFLEPFHDNSFYHHTHLGTYNTLATAGLTVHAVAPNIHWPVLRALWSMNAVPRIVQLILKMAQLIIQLRQSLRPMPIERVLKASGSFFFIAEKER